MSNVSVPVMDDMLAEGVNETFDLMLSSSLGPAITVDDEHTAATGVIIDTTSKYPYVFPNCNITSVLMIVLVIEFQSEQYIGSESSGIVEVAVIISGGSSTTPISVMVTTTGHTARGKEYIKN